MRNKLFAYLSIFCLVGFWNSISFAATVPTDNQILDLENKSVKDLSVNFKLQKFSSCENLENVLLKYIKDYSSIYPGFSGPNVGGDIMFDKGVTGVSNNASDTAGNPAAPTEVAKDYTQTNIQVAGVDESEIIKNDGDKIYYYNNKDKKVYIVKAFPYQQLKVLKTIKLPDYYINPELYISGNKLSIIATKYDNLNYGYYWFARNTKTVVIVYDLSDINNLKVDKYYQVDGNYMKSRKIGDYIYVLSSSNFSFPFVNYYGPMTRSMPAQLDDARIKTDFSVSRVLPKKAELRYTQDKKAQNYLSKGKMLPYNLSNNTAVSCSDVEYFIPDIDTLKKYNFNPSLVTLSIIDTKNKENPVKNKVLFGDVSEIYMSLDNLYITSNLYTNYNFRCPAIQCIKAPCVQSCAMPVFNSGENTLIHKISISKDIAKYTNSTIIPGSPLNQYSMDENSDGLFRIITTSFSPDRTISLYTLDKSLNLYSSLENIVKGENFQSSRFIGNKLYLVSFEQIDPLFVIDLKDAKNPKILGELKIPGYSTYLHPYDADNLIGIGYDTKTNSDGRTVNSGLKVDLYDVSNFSNPLRKYSLTLGDNGSYSEALNNPRLFVWNKINNILFLPVTLYKNANDISNQYRNSDAFQGSVAIKIDKNSGIKELARVTHIEAQDLEKKRKEECDKYASQISNPPKCEKIIGGGEYCPPASAYVPPYCYQSSTVGEYFASKIWEYESSFILRNLYFNNFWYTISNSKIQVNDMDKSFSKVSEMRY
ncbi:MAG: beta-propeller domain-containing protein [Candidatus Gracilibacteria bacterium]|nr:beta-propeller domain-containing protein [Candidatus Gracilibacteria bacterium]